ncbi:hypothetical protein QBC40DRAFT_16714 [Triangularia verruculosa]|uniref:Uncharacterized protein n=1 Tax=Triangularia verruculosa TaxID=2587418 RepID=A0AAN6XMY4_9PEZI|nr:hypothetical protein QBC40DRAFT_16714 [Triangularia verruculosa]
MMASLTLTPDSRMQRRDSSDRSASKRRPRLLRASATEPSITTSNASRNALCSQSNRRATDLLTRAFVSGSPPGSTSPLTVRPSMFDSVDRQQELSVSPVSQPDYDEHGRPSSGRYFSFPSFDDYEGSQQDDKETEIKSP